MITPVDFLKKELRIIADKFQNVNIKYGFDSMIDTHVVELLPLVEYNNNEELDKAWIPLSIKFLNQYDDQEIAFVSSDSSLSLKKVIFEFNPNVCTEENVMSEIYDELTKNQLNYTFSPSITQKVSIDGAVNKFLSLPVSKKANEINNAESDYCYLNAA